MRASTAIVLRTRNRRRFPARLPAAGAACLVTGFTALDMGLVRRPGFLDGLGICAGITLLVRGFALFAVAESRKCG
ncbi:hypothetical protein [Streptomyces sp. KMM 9044]|uniref:hypothetical protein n=1 Tax=Streptomyces sp. KMM 9044 TaxID=2744474 RepID=UPI0021734957|nr:hypothetical protein [Streptomyces sp. KMM 9044]WAX77188.1 hypothetical protein HUV60_005430 [Streptomyces sp. KMM 9044]